MKIGDKLTINSLVVLGLLLFNAAVAVFFVQRMADDTARLAEIVQPLERSALEMEIGASETARALLDYVWNHEEHELDRMRDAERDFERYAREFERLAESKELQALERKIAGYFQQFDRLGNEIVSMSEQRVADLALFREEVGAIVTAIEEKIAPDTDLYADTEQSEREAALEMQIRIAAALAATEGYILNPDPELKMRVAELRADFERIESWYCGTGLFAGEEHWLGVVAIAFTNAMMSGNRIIDLTDELGEKLAKFHRELDTITELVGGKFQVAVQTETRRAADQARTSGQITLVLLLATGLLVSMSVAIVSRQVSKVIVADVNQLSEGVAEFARGNLDHRIAVRTKDELGSLAGAFNAMAGQLERMSARTLRLVQIVEQSPVLIMVTDAVGNIEYVNPTFTETTGFTPDQVIGKNPHLLKSGHTSVAQYEELWATVRSGQPWSGEFHNKKHDGGSYWADATIAPLKNGNGEVSGFVGIQTDITKRKRAEAESARLEVELRHAHKMEAIGVLAGGIAHDFNNIIGAILGNAELALAKTAEEGSLQRNLQRIVTGSNRAKDLVRTILSFSREDNAESEAVPFPDVVREALDLVGAAVPAMVEIQTDIDPDCEPVLTDRSRMHQVVMNLCINASQAMNQAGGVLKVSLCGVDVDAALAEKNRQLSEGRYVKLTVADTGCGMDEVTRERIFDPFFTTKPVGEGSGMGLSVVHGTVAKAGGAIMVRSSVGKGTVFEVYLPACDEARSGHALQGSTDRVRGSGSVLLVDDETALVETTVEMLERLGYQVTAFDSSIEAIEAFREHPDRFDLVLTDQAMPRVSGLELAKAIRSIRADIPLIVATGYSDVVTPDKTREFGFCCYLSKPYDSQTLSAALREALGGKDTVAENTSWT